MDYGVEAQPITISLVEEMRGAGRRVGANLRIAITLSKGGSRHTQQAQQPGSSFSSAAELFMAPSVRENERDRPFFGGKKNDGNAVAGFLS